MLTSDWSDSMMSARGAIPAPGVIVSMTTQWLRADREQSAVDMGYWSTMGVVGRNGGGETIPLSEWVPELDGSVDAKVRIITLRWFWALWARRASGMIAILAVGLFAVQARAVNRGEGHLWPWTTGAAVVVLAVVLIFGLRRTRRHLGPVTARGARWLASGTCSPRRLGLDASRTCRVHLYADDNALIGVVDTNRGPREVVPSQVILEATRAGRVASLEVSVEGGELIGLRFPRGRLATGHGRWPGSDPRCFNSVAHRDASGAGRGRGEQ